VKKRVVKFGAKLLEANPMRTTTPPIITVHRVPIRLIKYVAIGPNQGKKLIMAIKKQHQFKIVKILNDYQLTCRLRCLVNRPRQLRLWRIGILLKAGRRRWRTCNKYLQGLS
jgi:hypothetical protein